MNPSSGASSGMEAFGQLIVLLTIAGFLVFLAALTLSIVGKRLPWEKFERWFPRLSLATSPATILGWLLGQANIGMLSALGFMVAVLRFFLGFFLLPIGLVLLLQALRFRRPWFWILAALALEAVPFVWFLWSILTARGM